MSLRATSGYVKLLLETEDGNVTTFQRSISQAAGKGNYVSVYAINEATVTWAGYEEKLKSFGILIKARNFLVFQVSQQALVSPHLHARMDSAALQCLLPNPCMDHDHIMQRQRTLFYHRAQSCE